MDSALLIDSRKNYQVKLVDPIRPNSSWQARQPFAYDKSQFKINWKTKKVTCPQGHKSITWTPNIDRWGNPGIQVRFSRSECFKCPQREQCCRSKKDGRTLRFLPKPEHKAIEDLRQQMETPQ